MLSSVGARTFKYWFYSIKESRTQRQRKLTYRKSGNHKSCYNAQRSGNHPYQPLKGLAEKYICSGRRNWLTFYFKKSPRANSMVHAMRHWCLIAAQHLRRVVIVGMPLLSLECLENRAWVDFTFFPLCFASFFFLGSPTEQMSEWNMSWDNRK